MTNIDYLDLVFKSIHYNTAKITNIMSAAGGTIISPNSNVSSMVKLKSEDTIDEKNSNGQFKAGIMSPPILLVGTNKNSLPKTNRNELIKKKFERIKEFTSNKIYSSHILEPYFAVENNNNNTDQQDDVEEKEQLEDDIELLKRHIQLAALSEPYMGEQQPLKWMNFDKSLEKLKNKGLFYASLSQVLFHFSHPTQSPPLCLSFIDYLN